jgi:hypothetical protein
MGKVLCTGISQPGDYARRLGQAGFRVDSIAFIPRPARLPGDITGWLETFAQVFFTGFPIPIGTTICIRSAPCWGRSARRQRNLDRRLRGLRFSETKALARRLTPPAETDTSSV